MQFTKTPAGVPKGAIVGNRSYAGNAWELLDKVGSKTVPVVFGMQKSVDIVEDVVSAYRFGRVGIAKVFKGVIGNGIDSPAPCGVVSKELGNRSICLSIFSGGG